MRRMTQNKNHMTTARVFSVFTLLLLVFLSFTPTISAEGALFSLAKPGLRYLYKSLFKKVFKDILNQTLASLDRPKNATVLEYGFYTNFSVGKNQEVTGWININSAITWIENYKYHASSPDYVCCKETSNDTNCDRYTPTDPTQCYRSQNGEISAADTFVFHQPLSSPEASFLWNISTNTTTNQTANGYLSFKRNFNSTSYSIVRNFKYPGFSYYFSYGPNSNITFSEQPDKTYNRSNFQSVQLIYNFDNKGYEDLYYVPAPQIKVGKQLLDINPTTDFLHGVIIDTSIPYILLATNVHDKVVTELKSQIGQPVQTDIDIPMCYRNKPKWPNLTLLFQPGNAKMVLNKHNYVDDSNSGYECATIYISNYTSVIGTMAQLDRKMIFDVNGSMLYFDQHSQDTGSSQETRPTIAIKFMMFYVMLLLFY